MTRRVAPAHPANRLLWAAIFAAALLLRLAIPQGWMPVTGAHGTHLVICTGTGPMALPGSSGAAHARPEMRHGMAGHDRDMADHACPFSAVATALVEPLLPVLNPPATVARLVPPAMTMPVSIGRGLAAPPPPSTGPPSLR